MGERFRAALWLWNAVGHQNLDPGTEHKTSTLWMHILVCTIGEELQVQPKTLVKDRPGYVWNIQKA